MQHSKLNTTSTSKHINFLKKLITQQPKRKKSSSDHHLIIKMAKSRTSSLSGKKYTIGTLAEKLQKGLSLVRPKSSSNDTNSVPNDVKEGHFAVIAAGGSDGPKRFVVPLKCLAHPTFRRLLERAAEEFGFDRVGALTVPCRPSELERILADKDSPAQWGPCNAMVKSY